ncbi:MAG TPA: glycosyltransferase family 4 protein, partial [Kineosporiaceae bacterium]|nr:glycosyltransferase family 4 protein [Kineosporiaceae bacterium]
AFGRSDRRSIRAGGGPSVMIVDAGRRFDSGISDYACLLAKAFARRGPTSTLLIRSAAPRTTGLRRRAGLRMTGRRALPTVPVRPGIDGFCGRSVPAAVRFLRSRRPDVLVLQWRAGTMVHSSLLLAAIAARQGTRVVLEWQQGQDLAGARSPRSPRFPVSGGYARRVRGLLLARCDGHVVHSEHDAALLRTGGYPLRGPVQVAPIGPYDLGPAEAGVGRQRSTFDAPDATSVRTLLSFGARQQDGVDDLVAAFDSLPDLVAARLRLVIVGETRRGRAVAARSQQGQITVLDGHQGDSDVRRLFGEADAVALPYRRSSAPVSPQWLHLAMSAGLPVLVSGVGSLREAAAEYAGAVLTEPGDVADIARGLTDLLGRCGRSFPDPHSWTRTLDAYDHLFAGLGIAPVVRVTRAGRQTELTRDQLVSQVVALSSPTMIGALR